MSPHTCRFLPSPEVNQSERADFARLTLPGIMADIDQRDRLEQEQMGLGFILGFVDSPNCGRNFRTPLVYC